jgi:hypothetical protein
MASPHITGAVALLWSGIPDLARNIPRTIQILTQSATRRDSTLCGGGFPNNVYGYGELDLSKALEYALSLNITSI